MHIVRAECERLTGGPAEPGNPSNPGRPANPVSPGEPLSPCNIHGQISHPMTIIVYENEVLIIITLHAVVV